jgi:hypothetical protein
MALPNLASLADLIARGVDTTTNPATVVTMLGVASSLVRQAAGSPVAQHVATVTFHATEYGEWLELPVKPVTAVASVSLDNVVVTGWKFVNGDLWRREGWYTYEPVEVEVTLTCGLPEVPAHIVQLVCDLAILGTKTAAEGAIDPRVVAERIDDYSVTFAKGAESVASAMTIPPMTRHSLRAQFGRGVGSVRMR